MGVQFLLWFQASCVAAVILHLPVTLCDTSVLKVVPVA